MLTRTWLMLAAVALSSSCANCTGVSVQVCNPDCRHGTLCNFTTLQCEPESCTTVEDCGPRTSYTCEARDGGSVKTCHLRGCIDDRDCSDGQFCNGEEQCDPTRAGADSFGCVTSAPPCATGLVCNEAMNRCQSTCATPDADGDGENSIACGGTDCDDNDPARAPGRTEVCDLADKDEDCDPSTFGFRDGDGDHFADARCCNGTGTSRVCGEDCDDTRANVHPNQPEVCNGRDDNCDGSIDFEVQIVAYLDADHDGYGAADAGAIRMCESGLGAGFSVYPNDCNDSNPAVTPGTFVCANPQFPADIVICNGMGVWSPSKCSGTLVCVTQPTGVGVCE